MLVLMNRNYGNVRRCSLARKQTVGGVFAKTEEKKTRVSKDKVFAVQMNGSVELYQAKTRAAVRKHLFGDTDIALATTEQILEAGRQNKDVHQVDG